MIVLHVETGRHFYGGARQAVYLIDALAARGITNHVVCPAGSAVARELAGSRIAELHDWPFAGELDWRLQSRLRRLLVAVRPDVLHVHSRRGADLFGGRAARAAGVPAILTRRVESAEPGIWTSCKLRPYRLVVAISRAVRDELTQRAGIDAERIRLIPSAVDRTRFAPDPLARQRLLDRYGLAAESCIAGVAAQLIARKGHEFLLALVAATRVSLPALRLLIFGQGPLRARLEREAGRLGVTDCVRFCGFVTDWPELVPGLDLLLHPARREGLGAVVLEAMSAGVAVLASAAGGIVDVVASGTDGWLVAPDDFSGWQDALLRLTLDPAARCQLGEAARRKVEEVYTIGRMTDSYLELYRHVSG